MTNGCGLSGVTLSSSPPLSFPTPLQVLRTLQYVNNDPEPSDQLERRVRISLGAPGFQPCYVSIEVINLPDPPSIQLPPG